MRRNPIAMIWLVGIVLAAALYLAGPEHFIAHLVLAVDQLSASLQDAFYALGVQAFDLVRAAAIALFVVFVALAVVARRRGLRTRGALLVVGLLFVFVLLGPGSGVPIRPDRWLAAFILSGVGAAVMTQRLVAPTMLAPLGTAGRR